MLLALLLAPTQVPPQAASLYSEVEEEAAAREAAAQAAAEAEQEAAMEEAAAAGEAALNRAAGGLGPAGSKKGGSPAKAAGAGGQSQGPLLSAQGLDDAGKAVEEWDYLNRFFRCGWELGGWAGGWLGTCLGGLQVVGWSAWRLARGWVDWGCHCIKAAWSITPRLSRHLALRESPTLPSSAARRRFNKAVLDKAAIDREKGRLEKENADLRCGPCPVTHASLFTHDAWCPRRMARAHGVCWFCAMDAPPCGSVSHAWIERTLCQGPRLPSGSHASACFSANCLPRTTA